MPTCADAPLSFRTLYESPLIVVSDYTCRAPRGGPGPEEHSDRSSIVLMRHGAFSRHFGRRVATADVNQAAFFSRGTGYRVSHPADCGDRGTSFAPAPRVLDEIRGELEPGHADAPGRPFLSPLGPCDDAQFWRHRDIVRRLEAAASEPIEPLWADVAALQLVADVLTAASARSAPPPQHRARRGTEQDHADRIEAVRCYLVAHLAERVTLDDLARAACLSPFHLARLFQRRTGLPVHRYLTRLRLRAALERLTEGADDLMALALDLGFSSHSHFADSFRREFGRRPSEMRPDRARRTLKEMRKIPEV